jgi:tetratricopeptide (TPR) repeat protein
MYLLRILRRLAPGVLLAVALAACAAPPETARLRATPGGLPTQADVAGVPFIPQQENYCGPASLAMALAWSGAPADQEAVAPQVFTPGREGTMRADMLAAARRNGRLAVPVGNLEDLLAELAAGHPVIVFQNLSLDWYPVWHFAVATGYDLASGEIRLHSGLERDLRMPLATFERTWARGDRWAMVVLPPEKLPATAGEVEVLQAAAGLERVGRLAEASKAYAAILQRWPDNFAARMGLGNARYGMGDITGAEAAFRAAIARQQTSGAAWNNLAQSLADQNRLAEAREAARRALALGGTDTNLYRATLQEIEDKQLQKN